MWTLAAVLVAATAAGCGNVSAGTVAKDPGEGASSTPADVHALAQRVYDSFAGTAAQQDAGQVLRAHAMNGPMDACLEEHGYPEWDWSLSRSYAAPYDPLRPTEWFAELQRRLYSENEIAMRDYLAAESEMNTDEGRPEAYEKAIDACLVASAQPSEDEVDRASTPKDTTALIEAWRSIMREHGQRLGGDPATYYQCMDAAELEVLTAAGAGYDEIGEVMAVEAGRAGPPPAEGEKPSEAWNRFLVLEGEVIAADAACRQDVHDEHIAELAPVITAFAEEHADAISRAQSGWDEIENQAAEFGYHGQRGPLGR